MSSLAILGISVAVGLLVALAIAWIINLMLDGYDEARRLDRE